MKRMCLTAHLAALALGVTVIGSTRAEAQLTCLKPTAGAEAIVAVFLSDDATKGERERLGIKVQHMEELRPLTDAADAALCRKLDLAFASLPAYYFRTGPYVIGTNDPVPRFDGADPTVYVFDSLGREIPPVCPARYSAHCRANERPQSSATTGRSRTAMPPEASMVDTQPSCLPAHDVARALVEAFLIQPSEAAARRTYHITAKRVADLIPLTDASLCRRMDSTITPHPVSYFRAGTHIIATNGRQLAVGRDSGEFSAREMTPLVFVFDSVGYFSYAIGARERVRAPNLRLLGDALGMVTLAWSRTQSNAMRYQLQRASGSAPFVPVGRPLLRTATGATDSAAPAGVARRYRLIVVGPAGDSAYSNEVTLTPTRVGASARRCWPPDEMADLVIREGTALVTDSIASKFRKKFGIPSGTAADVTLVQDDALCEAVTAGFERARKYTRDTDALIVVQLGNVSPFYLVREHDLLTPLMYLLTNEFDVLTLIGHPD